MRNFYIVCSKFLQQNCTLSVGIAQTMSSALCLFLQFLPVSLGFDPHVSIVNFDSLNAFCHPSQSVGFSEVPVKKVSFKLAIDYE